MMHIEKNVFDNIFNTVMDTPWTKDNANARKDVVLYCKRRNLELVVQNNKILKPSASYVLKKSEQAEVYKWMKGLRFPDGYASNIAACVDLTAGKVTAMKSHDCHVFMERLLPMAFREMLPTAVWNPLAELSIFFRDICSSKLSRSRMQALEHDIVITLCKLEKIFPPAFFDSMEHLPIHLPYEAIVGGPVQFRKSGNNGGLLVLSKSGRPVGTVKRKLLDIRDLNAAHYYILNNCPEVDNYIE
nr:DUF4218 domain-containing protein [Serratia marcescens]